ncbi:MAG: hypothetical protein AAB403_07275 [Planctomycetota bacterium]
MSDEFEKIVRRRAKANFESDRRKGMHKNMAWEEAFVKREGPNSPTILPIDDDTRARYIEEARAQLKAEGKLQNI